MNKVVAYLDILGFSNHTYTNIEDALELLSDYNTIINTKILDAKQNPSSSYPKKLQGFAKQNFIDSFEYFLPFSDSLFIQSSTPDEFIKQLSSFLLDCFFLNSNDYSNPEDYSDPSKVTIKILKNKSVFQNHSQYRHPLFFRGGVSYGETNIFNTDAIIDSKLKKITNIAGATFVKTVKELEPLGKGPRLFCDLAFYAQLDEKTKLYCKIFKEKYYEILWPAFNFIEGNELETEKNKINELLVPATNLWKAYNHLKFGIHYWEFLKLVISSTIRFFEIQNNKEIAQNYISRYLKSVGLTNKESALLKTE